MFTDRYPILTSELETELGKRGVVVTKFRNAWRTCLHHEVTMDAWNNHHRQVCPRCSRMNPA